MLRSKVYSRLNTQNEPIPVIITSVKHKRALQNHRNIVVPLLLNNPSILFKDSSFLFSFLFSSETRLPVCEFYINKTEQLAFYCAQFILLTIMIVRLIHVVGLKSSLLIFIVMRNSIVQNITVYLAVFVWMDIWVIFSLQLLYILLLWFFSICCLCTCIHISAGHILRSERAWS